MWLSFHRYFDLLSPTSRQNYLLTGSFSADHLGIQMPPRPAYQVPWTLPNVSPEATGLSTSYTTPSINSVFSGSNYSPSNNGSPLSEMGSASDYFGSFDVEPPQITASSIAPSVRRGRPNMGRPGIGRSVSYSDTSPSSREFLWRICIFTSLTRKQKHKHGHQALSDLWVSMKTLLVATL